MHERRTAEKGGARISYLLVLIYETKERLEPSHGLGNTGQRFYLFLQRYADCRLFDDS